MDLLKSFLVSLRKEPFKTMHRLEVIDDNNLLTDNGAKLFLSWLLEENKEKFNKDVIEKIKKENRNHNEK